jgi:hypothetical protein
VHLPTLIDVVTIAARIAIILAIADNRADHASQDAANGCTCAGPDSRYDRTRESAGSRADDCSGRSAGNYVIPVRVGGACSHGKAAYGGGGDQQAFHIIVLQGSSPPPGFSPLTAAMAARDPS